VTDLQYQGRVLLNTRINLYSGHPPPPDAELTGVDFWRGHDERWHVVRHEAKKAIWAISTHASATKQHQVKYHLVATHKATGVVVKATVWKCARRASSEIHVLKKPNGPTRRCWLCSKF
jgi:hypothetical protein